MPARAGILVLLVPFACASPRDSNTLTVYSASSLTEPIEDAARVYAESTGVRVETRFDASGILAAAIQNGAPADVFIAADASCVDLLSEKRLLVAGSARIIAWNCLAFVVPEGSSAAIDHPEDLRGLRRIAIGDSGIAPVGRYAAQALRNLGLRPLLAGRFVEAPDARGVLALVERAEVDGGVVYQTDARKSSRVRLAFLFSETVHDPVAYPAALVTSSPHMDAARRFLEFLSSPRGRAIFLAHGFLES